MKWLRGLAEALSWAYSPDLMQSHAEQVIADGPMDEPKPDLTWFIDGEETTHADLGDVFQDRGAEKHVRLQNTTGQHLRDVEISVTTGSCWIREPWVQNFGKTLRVEHLAPGESKQFFIEIPTWMPPGRHEAKLDAKGDFVAAPYVSKFSKWESYG